MLSVLLAVSLSPKHKIGFEVQKRPITVEDCVRTRRIVMEEVKLSPGGDKVAYVVKAPDVARNVNVFQLFVRELEGNLERGNGHMVFAGEHVSQIKWLADSSGVLLLTTGKDNKSRLVKVEVPTGKTSTIFESASSIEDYTADGSANRVVFSVLVPSEEVRVDPEDLRRGYAITFGRPKRTSEIRNPRTTRFNLFVSNKGDESSRTVSELKLKDEALLSSPILNLRNLNLSPDGKFLVFNCNPDHIPTNWSENIVGRGFLKLGINPSVLALYEMSTGRLRLAINAPDPHYQILWSGDSREFAVNSVFPVGSLWEKQELKSRDDSFKTATTNTHILAVDAVSGAVSLILKNPPSDDDLPLSWQGEDGPMIVRIDSKVLAEMKRDRDEWHEVRRFVSADQHYGVQYPGMSDGQSAIGSTERPWVPPDLTRTSLVTGESIVLTDLNPEYKSIELGDIENVEWKNKFGALCTGYLIKPVGYKDGKAYPLVIMAKGWSEDFLADTSYRTAFPPQALANSGFMVLMTNPPSFDKEPKEYPGQMGEAFNFMEMVESAVAFLSNRGLIDKNQVGIIGFSRTSWLVDFMLTHSKLKFAAASSADSGAYNYGAYWLSNDERLLVAEATQYGGPPYGESLRTWLDYAPGFNTQNVQAPLLMEYTKDWIESEPLNAYELFVGLRSQRKPVELFYYPQGEHELDTPAERIASLQRNVDWFRFWIQGYEGKAPDYDLDQFVRWRELRKLQDGEASPRKSAPQE